MANFYSFYPPSGGGSVNPSVGPNGSPAPTSSTEIGFIDGSGNLQGVSPTEPLPVAITGGGTPFNVNVADFGGNSVVTGTGVSGAGIPRVTVASDSTIVLPTGAATAANQTTEIAAINTFSAKSASAFVNAPFDETVITYVGATTNIATVTYKLVGVTVNTLTMTYDGSNRLTDVVKT